MKRPVFIARQSGHPSGLAGKLIARIMAVETVPENLHALALLQLQPGDRFLDIGTGHGTTMLKAAQSEAIELVAGIDPSKVMVKLAIKLTRQAPSSVDIQVRQADVSSIPFPDQCFSKLVTVHTFYFWEDLNEGLKEIYRVTRAGGRFVSCFHPGDDPVFNKEFPDIVYQKHHRQDVLNAIQQAGFTIVRVVDQLEHKRLNSLVFVVAEKSVGLS